jgi:hypothetical protein
MQKLSGIFHLTLNLHKMLIGDEITLALTLKIGSSTLIDITKLPYSQSVLQTRANAVQTLMGSRVNLVQPTLTKQEQQALSDLSFALTSDANEISRQANEKAAGNKVTYETIITGIGLHPSSPHAKHSRIFEVRPAGKGAIHIILPEEKQFGTPVYLFLKGYTTAEGVLSANFDPIFPLPHTEIFVDGLKSGNILCVEYAALIIPPHKKTTPASGSSSATPLTKTAINTGSTPQKMVTLLPVNKQGKVTITEGVNYFHFSDPIYIIVP